VLTRLNRRLLGIAAALLSLALILPARPSVAQILPGGGGYDGCSPCTTNTGGDITHSWTEACCYGSSDCYWFPDSVVVQRKATFRTI
jgi:hypothetical protein